MTGLLPARWPALAWAALAACLAMLVSAGCVGESRPTFVAIGGGLRDDNDAIYAELLPRNHAGTIVIVPFASADPVEAAARTTERFRTRRPGARIITLPDPLAGHDAAATAAEWIARADLVFFTGGDQSRITPRFLGGESPNALLRALRDAQTRSGTIVGGTSAGCAVLSDPMFTGGGSESALGDLPATDGEEDEAAARGVRLGPGLGLVEGVILDSHFPERGRHGRMVAALESAGLRFGLGVAENRALRITGDTFTAIGTAAAIVVDIGDLAREGASRRGVRLSLLSDGDVFHLHPSPGRPHVLHAGRRIDRLPSPPPDAPVGGPWDRNVVLTMLARLAADPASPQSASSERFRVVLTADERTIFAWRDGEPGTLRVIDARLDILARSPPP
jgi:cyanophycinase